MSCRQYGEYGDETVLIWMPNRVKGVGGAARQRRNYDLHYKGRHLDSGELVWLYSPQRKKGHCPKLDSDWVGPCRVLERLGEVVYRVRLPPMADGWPYTEIGWPPTMGTLPPSSHTGPHRHPS